jgi:hypothetical protein
LFTLAFKICNKEANTTLSMAQPVSIEFWVSLIFIGSNTIFHNNNFCITLWFSPAEYFPAVF